MTAQPNPSPSNKRRDPIEAFQETYGAAFADAEVSATHTETEGWQRLYAGRQKDEQDQRTMLAAELKRIAVLMEDTGLTEDDEKALAEVKKDSIEIRDRRAAFEQQTIGPVRKPVLECDRIIADARSSARREESEAPLHNVGLEELVRLETNKVARPRWDSEAGKVWIEQPTP